MKRHSAKLSHKSKSFGGLIATEYAESGKILVQKFWIESENSLEIFWAFSSQKEFTSKWPFRTKAWTQESTAIETQKAGAWKIDFIAWSSKNDILLDRARLPHISVLKIEI